MARRQQRQRPALVLTAALLALLLCTAAGVAAAEQKREFKPIAYTPCKEPSAAATAVSITSVTGDLPARAASTFIVHVGARPERPLEGGKITMEIKALGVKVATRSFNICKDLDVACPVPAGEHVVAKFKFPVPWYAITMQAAVVITAVDTKGEQLICLEAPEVPVVAWKNKGKGDGGDAHAHAPAAVAEAEATAAEEAAAAAATTEAVTEVPVMEGGAVNAAVGVVVADVAPTAGAGDGAAAASPALRRREMVQVEVKEVFLAL